MKRKIRHIILVFALVLAAGCFSAVPASAASKISSASFGKTYKVTDSYNTLYKITVKKTGILAVNNKTDSSFGFYKKTKATKYSWGTSYYTDSYVSMSSCSSKKTTYIAIKKGTYYIDPGKGTFSIKYIKPVNKANYTRSKAITLKKNKQVIVSQFGATNYNRWYKIKLTKKQAVTLKTNNKYNVDIYDSNGIKVATTTDSNSSEVYSKPVKKGTYYIRIGYIDTYTSDSVDEADKVVVLKWS